MRYRQSHFEKKGNQYDAVFSSAGLNHYTAVREAAWDVDRRPPHRDTLSGTLFARYKHYGETHRI